MTMGAGLGQCGLIGWIDLEQLRECLDVRLPRGLSGEEWQWLGDLDVLGGWYATARRQGDGFAVVVRVDAGVEWGATDGGSVWKTDFIGDRPGDITHEARHLAETVALALVEAHEAGVFEESNRARSQAEAQLRREHIYRG